MNVHVPLAPSYLDIELTNVCNFACVFCPTGIGIQRRRRGFMAAETFQKIIDEIQGTAIGMRFVRWGEPTLHPRWIAFLREAKQRDILCHLTTNGSRLDDESMSDLVNMGLDCIRFSFQGVDSRTFRAMRRVDDFSRLLSTVNTMKKCRGDKPRPLIHVQTSITIESASRVNSFVELARSVADVVTVGRTVLTNLAIGDVDSGREEREQLAALKMEESLATEHPTCNEVFDKLSVNWDGTISACCADFDNVMIVGNLAWDSILQVWRSEKMQRYRLLLSQMRHDEIPLCRHCIVHQGRTFSRYRPDAQG
jgi:radical SAM protein with 4Fe4S-binding SPASM domain